ncbi:hypothetical protein [Beijerinckia mobilis]|uniref:hypothetical protein n=1 Tax=Beijerinckia mobilis TaxID=231434 RepID=UPI0012EC31CD|nr:hypothetical protein [Beijerinckia mobilis]
MLTREFWRFQVLVSLNSHVLRRGEYNSTNKKADNPFRKSDAFRRIVCIAHDFDAAHCALSGSFEVTWDGFAISRPASRRLFPRRADANSASFSQAY